MPSNRFIPQLIITDCSAEGFLLCSSFDCFGVGFSDLHLKYGQINSAIPFV